MHACLLGRFCWVRLFAALWARACRLLCPWDSLAKNTGVGCHAPLQGIFPTQRRNQGLLHWQVGSSPGKPRDGQGEFELNVYSWPGPWLGSQLLSLVDGGRKEEGDGRSTSCGTLGCHQTSFFFFLIYSATSALSCGTWELP